jgi:hypothetical protein
MREYVMGIRSWFGSRRSRRKARNKHSLIRNQRDDPRLRRIQQAAAADVAAVCKDDRYFDPNGPGRQGT